MPLPSMCHSSDAPSSLPSPSTPYSDLVINEAFACGIQASNGVLVHEDQLAIYEYILSAFLQPQPQPQHHQHKHESSPPIESKTATAYGETSSNTTTNDNPNEALNHTATLKIPQASSPKPFSSPTTTTAARSSTKQRKSSSKPTTITTKTYSSKKQSSRTLRNAKGRACANCKSTETCVWRKAKGTGEILCNSCGVYQNAHRKPRPLELKKDTLYSRNRKKGGCASSSGVKKGGSMRSVEYTDSEEDEEENKEFDSGINDLEVDKLKQEAVEKTAGEREGSAKDWMLKFGG
ncbi:UNVERIFIED_CONTAM: Transcription factor [Siphonaria sp. JEL0065]|nr:Transcription factor [Siphonaria sp. JEL0065]